jgi:hypothetical protein
MIEWRKNILISTIFDKLFKGHEYSKDYFGGSHFCGISFFGVSRW